MKLKLVPVARSTGKIRISLPLVPLKSRHLLLIPISRTCFGALGVGRTLHCSQCGVAVWAWCAAERWLVGMTERGSDDGWKLMDPSKSTRVQSPSLEVASSDEYVSTAKSQRSVGSEYMRGVLQQSSETSEEMSPNMSRLVRIINSAVAIGFLFGGAGLCLLVDLGPGKGAEIGTWLDEDTNETWPTDMNGNESWRDGETFAYGLIYAASVATTMGNGRDLGTSGTTWAAVVVYAMLVVPLFSSFLNYAAWNLRGLVASVLVKLWEKERRGGEDKSKSKATGTGTSTERRPSAVYTLQKCLQALVPVVLMLALLAVFTLTIAGVFYSTQQFDTYSDAYFFLFQSAALIGFGTDASPANEQYRLLYFVFVVVGIVLFHTFVIVMRKRNIAVARLIARGLTMKTQQELEQETLADMMGPIQYNPDKPFQIKVPPDIPPDDEPTTKKDMSPKDDLSPPKSPDIVGPVNVDQEDFENSDNWV